MIDVISGQQSKIMPRRLEVFVDELNVHIYVPWQADVEERLDKAEADLERAVKDRDNLAKQLDDFREQVKR